MGNNCSDCLDLWGGVRRCRSGGNEKRGDEAGEMFEHSVLRWEPEAVIRQSARNVDEQMVMP